MKSKKLSKADATVAAIIEAKELADKIDKAMKAVIIEAQPPASIVKAALLMIHEHLADCFEFDSFPDGRGNCGH